MILLLFFSQFQGLKLNALIALLKLHMSTNFQIHVKLQGSPFQIHQQFYCLIQTNLALISLINSTKLQMSIFEFS